MKTNIHDTFQCKLNNCTFTCCDGWNIEVDEKTQQLWQSKQLPPMEENHCPYLEKGLCHLYANYIIDYVPQGCQKFPYLDSSLSLGCEEVVEQLETLKIIEPDEFTQYLLKYKDLSIHEILEKACLWIDPEVQLVTSKYLKRDLEMMYEDITVNYKTNTFYKDYFTTLTNQGNEKHKLQEYETLLKNAMYMRLLNVVYEEDLYIVVLETIMVELALKKAQKHHLLNDALVKKTLVVFARMIYHNDVILDYLDEYYQWDLSMCLYILDIKHSRNNL